MQSFEPLQAETIVVPIIRRCLIAFLVREVEAGPTPTGRADVHLPLSARSNDPRAIRFTGPRELADACAFIWNDRQSNRSKARFIADH